MYPSVRYGITCFNPWFKVQKEREAEGDQFADKEKFVTSAYRKKMEEMSQAEEEEARQARMEAALDVTKQNDLSGFYRHIYRQVFVNCVRIGRFFFSQQGFEVWYVLLRRYDDSYPVQKRYSTFFALKIPSPLCIPAYH